MMHKALNGLDHLNLSTGVLKHKARKQYNRWAISQRPTRPATAAQRYLSAQMDNSSFAQAV